MAGMNLTETASVNICYRPLRIAWAIQSADKESLRRAVRLNHTFWGGRYNPIVFADRPEEAGELVEVFRADHIVPLGDGPAVKEIRNAFPHLISPMIPDELFLDRSGGHALAQVLDVQNAVARWRNEAEWNAAKERGFRRVVWDSDDPLADVFLMQFGAYPDASETGIDYEAIFSQATMAVDLRITKDEPIPDETVRHPGIAYLSRHALRRHHVVRPGWSFPGFFVGDSSSADDLVAWWNLRAADIGVTFVDERHATRYERLLPFVKSAYQEEAASYPDGLQNLAIWQRSEDGVRPSPAPAFLGEGNWSHCGISRWTWNGLNVRPPMMILGEASAMGVLGKSDGRPSISFALGDKPFDGDFWFHTQHLVASLKLYRAPDEQHTFQPPYVPELNETFARTMYLHYDKLRIEPDRVGIVIDAADHEITLRAFPVSELVERTFALAGLKAMPSNGGLIARQLISRLGGFDGARVFKIPGVRRLLKTYGPNTPFTQRAALQLIAQTDNKSGARFAEHEDLYIEQRAIGTKLTPQMVFGYLVEKGLFRIGMEITCPTCNLPSWVPLDNLRQTNTCELCGISYDATRQLVAGEFRYRRTGVLGIEKNTQGAVPVALLLQQLAVNLHTLSGDVVMTPSFNLEPQENVDLPKCEVDFVVICDRTYPEKAGVIIGECKDEGDRIDQTDIENLRLVAEAIPHNRFNSYILLARLSPFSEDEIAMASALNDEHRERVILLSARELEPYHLYDRVNQKSKLHLHGGSPEALARATAKIYFTTPPRDAASALTSADAAPHEPSPGAKSEAAS